MEKELAHKIFRILLLIIGAAVTVNALVITFVSNFNLGVICTWIAGVFFLGVGVFYNFFREKVHLIIKCVLAVGVAAVVGLVSFVYIYGGTDTAKYDEDAVIVLGAGIHGEQLSYTLKKRLDSAVEYNEKNPDAVIVVSGGQGPQEDITEALAMERYLISKGVPAERIIKEENSTSTAENFRFSKALLDGHFDRPYTVTYITDNFHIYRAGKTAAGEGFSDATHCHSVGHVYTVLPNGFRECLAVLHMWVFG